MFPLWKIAIAPVLEAIGAKKVVEIGALRGETTILMLEHLGPEAELHVIDPVPEFDPAEHEQMFPGRYIFHRDISHNVLPTLAPMDAALIDGDHNWYTVYHELKMLGATARANGAPLPVMVMHDVCWPYGRRDLYYTPELIPEEFRQPYDQRGMARNRKELLPKGRGGLSPTMNNAIREGGPRNGVMTALDDFEKEWDKPLRRLVLPVYFGLAIVAEQELVDRQPALAKVFDHLESREALEELLDLTERLRIRAMQFQHSAYFGNEDSERLAHQYLDLLKGALIDEHYIENELRIEYLVDCIQSKRMPDNQQLRDPMRYMRDGVRPRLAARRTGQVSDAADDGPAYFPYTTMGRTRLDQLQQCLDTVRTKSVPGDLVECGTGRGGGAAFLLGYRKTYEMNKQRVWIADNFRATPPAETVAESRAELKKSSPGTRFVAGGPGFPELLADLNVVRDALHRFDVFGERVRFLQGPFETTLPDAPINKIALLRIGATAAAQACEILDILYDKIAVGGFVVIEHYDGPSFDEALEAFRTRRGITDPIERVDAACVSWTKSAEATGDASPRAQATERKHAPIAPAAPTDRCDLSVVAVFYNMRREAERTLHSLSRAYQTGIDDLDYEVIVLENGSDADQKLSEEFVQSFGPQFRYVDLSPDAKPSPVTALNHGIAVARGDVLALMIDGAHVLTPGVLRFGTTGMRSYEPAVVVAQQWYVGPGQQPDMMLSGYDQDYEDRLFSEIDWPIDGYRLFEIGHFIGERDWFDGLWESNCVFVSRKQLEQVGGFDENFDMPGGGAANLEIYERLTSSPDLNVVSILGEGTFHQIHGGTTTNHSEVEKRREKVSAFMKHLNDLRGKTFRGHGKGIYYVGAMGPGRSGALRTKARRRSAQAFQAVAAQGSETAIPLPEDFRFDFIDAFWRNRAWEESTWLGTRVAQAPTDLMAYQEILTATRPDWVIDFPSNDGGRALFLASICEMLDHGHVLSIDPGESAGRVQHPRIRYLTGEPGAETTVAAAREIVGPEPRALVVLGSNASMNQTMREFSAYAPFVAVGSYLVIEGTILNGHPVDAEFGPGPHEAVRRILNTRSDFAQDPAPEKYALTFNPGGFLKRLR